MKKIVLLTCVCAISFVVATAQVVVFDYDNAGNRIKREISSPVNAAPGRSNMAPSKMIESDFVTIGPNPTTGIVRVEISNFEPGDKGLLHVFTTSGQLIAKIDILSSVTEINIGSHAAGIYVFVVETDKVNARSMIIKK